MHGTTDCDDEFEYRHVILPKQMLKMLPKRWVASNAMQPSTALADVATEIRGISHGLAISTIAATELCASWKRQNGEESE
jgi:hypothetical protein